MKTEFNLEKFKANSLKNEIVVFDFDGTLIQGDCSDEMLLALMDHGHLTSEILKSNSLMPENSDLNPFEYYQWLLGCHKDEDYVEGHVWMLKALGVLRLEDVLIASKRAFVGEKRTIHFHPKVLAILENCLLQEAECYILSASPEIIIKYLVQHFLNPDLKKRNIPEFPLERVKGIEFEKLCDFEIRENRIHWESYYDQILGERVLYPAPSGKGKAMFINQYCKQKPLFSFSDSTTDFPLLDASENGVIVLQNGDKSWDSIENDFYVVT